MAHLPNNPQFTGPLFDLMRLSRPHSAEPPAIAAATIVDEGTLDRIIDAVGKHFIPATFNRNTLWNAIVKAGETTKLIDRFRPGVRTRATAKSIKRISRAAESLAAAIKKMTALNS
jgi:hypothetical protein